MKARVDAMQRRGGEEISYKRKKAAGGELDVDMCLLLRGED